MKLFWTTLSLSGVAAAGVVAVIAPQSVPTETAVQAEFAIGEPEPPRIGDDSVVPKPAAPLGFDLLRIEEESILIAGRAAPESEIEIVLDDATTGRVRTDRSGGFVYVHQGPPGNYSFRLRADGRLSDQVAVVASAPGGERLALITQPDEATTLLHSPFAPAAEAPGVTVEAVDVQDGELFVAGKAKAAGLVRIYLDGTLVGEARTNEKRRYFLQVPEAMEAGRHEIRADLLVEGAEVASRAQVSLLHEPKGVMATLEDDPDALRTGASIIIRPGDSLWRISRRAYGKGTRYTTIFEANRSQIRNPDRIFAGQVFKLPTSETTPKDG